MLRAEGCCQSHPIAGVEASPAARSVTLLSARCQKVLLKLDLERLEAFFYKILASEWPDGLFGDVNTCIVGEWKRNTSSPKQLVLALSCLEVTALKTDSAITWGVRSLLRSRVTGSGPSEKVVSWGVALKSSEVRRGFPLSARKWITRSFSYQNYASFDWGNLQCKSKGRAECLSAGAFHAIREYHASPALFVSGTVWGSSTSDPLTTQRDGKSFLLNFMIFSQMFYLTLLRWTVALTDYICKTIHTAVAARQLGSRVVSGDTYVAFFFTKQFLKILKPFLTSSWSCYWNVRIFFTLCRPV